VEMEWWLMECLFIIATGKEGGRRLRVKNDEEVIGEVERLDKREEK
jgi:hypothetical protein